MNEPGERHPALTDPEAAARFLRGLGRVYTPDARGGRVCILQPWQGKNFGKPLCRASVHEAYGVGFHQCVLPGVEQTADPEGTWFCHIHGPTGVASREARMAEKRRSEEARRAAARRRALDGNPLVQALLRIAQGDNDPRTTAREALGPLWSELSDEDAPERST